MKWNRSVCSALLFTALVGCASGPRMEEHDALPMFGASGEAAQVSMIAKGQSMANKAMSEFGSKEKAIEGLTSQGFNAYQHGELQQAVRKLNRAWLLDANRSEVYWGFALVLTEQNQFCQALEMVKTSQAKGGEGSTFLTDAALIYSGCALELKNKDSAQVMDYIKQSDELFKQALEANPPNKEYVLYQWARALYKRGDYEGAWNKVKEHRVTTGRDPDQRFLRSLSQRMLEPR